MNAIISSKILLLLSLSCLLPLPASAMQNIVKSINCSELDGKPGENGRDGLPDSNCKNGGNGGQGKPNINNGSGGNGGHGGNG